MKCFKYDLHVHTMDTSRCGMVDGARMVRLYKKAGYQGIVIADHYYHGYFDE